MHPKDNTFLTGSDDQTVLMWDLRANEATVSSTTAADIKTRQF